MHFVAGVKGSDDIYRPEDLALMATVKVDYLAFVGPLRQPHIEQRRDPPGTAVNNYMPFGNQDNPFLKATEWNWQIDPLGFRTIITVTITIGARRYLIENGIGVIESWTANIPLPMITASLTIATISTP